MENETLLSMFGEETFTEAAKGNFKSMTYYHKGHTRYNEAYKRAQHSVHILLHHRSHQPEY